MIDNNINAFENNEKTYICINSMLLFSEQVFERFEKSKKRY
ncbi:MAG: hypothetical protein HeimC3_19200 [Candidatus Heimdallarchaeota archaeon LC_3]|nr:MAG: hypothetical protein HeimC3_19200 [Candidatus Heimdallarchaeota archaeon LC_3]